MSSAVRFTLLPLSLLLVGYHTNADVLRVRASSAAATPDGTSWENAYQSIQAALLRTSPGDELWVAQGSYFGEEITTVDDVNLYGGFAGNETSRDQRRVLEGDTAAVVSGGGAYTLTIDHAVIVDGFHFGAGGPGVVRFNADGVLRNCFVANNTFSSGFAGGVDVATLNATIDKCIIANNVVTVDGDDVARGGGIGLRDGSGLVLTDSVVASNQVVHKNDSNGGGIFVGEGAMLDMSGCVVRANVATGDGGGVFVSPSATLYMTNCDLVSNSAKRGGGLAILNNASENLHIVDVRFLDNMAGPSGGGAYVESTPATFTDCLFENNFAHDTAQGGYGGGLALYRAAATVSECIFAGNRASSDGGSLSSIQADATITGCHFEGGAADSGGALLLSQGAPLVSNCTFYDNRAGQRGGAIYTVLSDATIRESKFIGNSALVGGAASTLENQVLITNSLFARNQANHHGGAIAASATPPQLIGVIATCCTFADNTSTAAGTTFYSGSGPGFISLVSCVVDAPSDANFFNRNYGQLTAETSNLPGGAAEWGEGNIDEPVIFMDPAKDDYRLAEGSPGIDAVDAGDVTTDLRGLTRPVGAAADMGAYERQTEEPPILADNLGDINNDGAVNAIDVQLAINAALGLFGK